MDNNLETKNKTVSTQFDGWGYLFRDTSLQTAGARALLFELIGFWGMHRDRRCFPAQATLMKKLGIKSADTLRSQIEELVESGHIAFLNRSGRKTEYFLMFVEGADKDLLAASQKEVRDRKAARNSKRKKPEAGEGVPQSNPTSERVTSDTAPTAEVTPEETNAHRFGSWVKTEADMDLANTYDAELALMAEDKAFAEPTGFPVQHVVSDVAEAGLTDLNSTPRCFIAGATLMPTSLLPGRWVENWGSNYGAKFTISQIASVYDELLAVEMGQGLTSAQVHEVDVAMHVLGQDGFVPSKKAINALRYAPELDPHMSELRVRYQETLRARELCLEHILRGNYDITTNNR